MLDKRTNVLLRKSDYIALTRIAKKQDSTVSELIRYALQQTFKLSKKDSQYKVLERIDALSSKVNTKDIDYFELIADGRKY